MHCFINLCRCCLSSDIPPTTNANEYLCKKEQVSVNTSNYYDHISDIYPDLQLKKSLPFNLCTDCQRLLREATKMKNYLLYQMEDKDSQQLLMKESMCSGCFQFSSSLFVTIDVSQSLDVYNKSYIDILKGAFPYYQFQSHISYKYCGTCSNYVKSVYLLKELLSQNNALYSKYCSTLIASSEQVVFSLLLVVPETKTIPMLCLKKEKETHEENMFVTAGCLNSADTNIIIKDEISDISNNLYNNTENNCKIEQKQINDKLEWSNTEEKPYKCNICLKEFLQEESLNVHKQTRFHEKAFKCCECQKTCSTKSALRTHEKIHTGKKLYKCNLCPKAFYKNKLLIRHKRLHTEEKPFKCEICPKAFLANSDLKRHQRTHTGEKPYKCNICPKAFSDNSNLTIHKRVHTGEKPYKCKMCTKAFTQKINLLSHNRKHTGEKPYKCNMCSKAFCTNAKLQIHNRTHTTKKLYKCDICLKTFTRQSYLNLHKRIHTEEKPYKCDLCEKAFSTKGSLTMHKRYHIIIKKD